MRVKRGVVSHRKHKKLLASVKGYRMSKHRLIKVAKEAALHAGFYAFSGRRRKKSEMRKLWITRISNTVRGYDMSYSEMINKLKKHNIILDRKIMSQMLLDDKGAFSAIIDRLKSI